MHIDIRPVAKLRGPGAVDVPAALGPVFSALSATAVDLARLRVVCDWIQYRSNFAEPVACRAVLAEPVLAEPGRRPRAAGEHGQVGGPAHGRQDGLEIAIDLRRCAEVDLATRLKEALAAPPGGTHPGWSCWSRGCPPARAASGGSTRCTGRRCRVGGGHRPGVRAGAARRPERRPQHRAAAGD